MDISKRIKFIREQKGLSQKAVADKMGLEQPNYGRFERRGRKLTLEQLDEIAEALGVTAKEILYGDEGGADELQRQKLSVSLSQKDQEINYLKKLLETSNKENEFLKGQIEKLHGLLEKDNMKTELDKHRQAIATLTSALKAKGIDINDLFSGPESAVLS